MVFRFIDLIFNIIIVRGCQDYAMLIATNITAGKTYGVIAAIPNEKIELINKVKVGDFVNVEGICVGTVKQANPTIISIQIQDPKINQ